MALGEVILAMLVCAAVAPLIGIPRVIGRSRRKLRSRPAPVIATVASVVLVGIIAFTIGRGGGVTPHQVVALLLNVVWLILSIRSNAAAKIVDDRGPKISGE